MPRVFIVDDEPVIASTLAANLRLHGYSATFFTSSQQALTAAGSKAPNLLISDAAMPGISGIDLAVQVKAQYRARKILLFSGKAGRRNPTKNSSRQGLYLLLIEKPTHPSAMLPKVGAVAPERKLDPIVICRLSRVTPK